MLCELTLSSISRSFSHAQKINRARSEIIEIFLWSSLNTFSICMHIFYDFFIFFSRRLHYKVFKFSPSLASATNTYGRRNERIETSLGSFLFQSDFKFAACKFSSRSWESRVVKIEILFRWRLVLFDDRWVKFSHHFPRISSMVMKLKMTWKLLL